MATCDLCGTDTTLYNTVIEGSQLQACKRCSGYGTVKGPAKSAQPTRKRQPVAREEPVEHVPVSDVAKRLRHLRETHSLTQVEFAHRINERESLVPKWESGTLKPTIPVLRKIERMFHVTLTEADTPIVFNTGKKKSASFTLGDFIKIKD